MPTPRVLILYNEPTLPADHPIADSEHEILYVADVVARTLIEAGYAVQRLGVSEEPHILIEALRARRPDVVFNLFEGTARFGNTEAFVGGILEWLGIPFTGSPTQALCLARNKPLTKQLLRGAGLPTAGFFVAEIGEFPLCLLPWPVIVKPAREDASVGIEQASVVTSQAQLDARVAHVHRTFGQPALIEQFLSGREFNVGLIENPTLRTLPVSEILFTDQTGGSWPLVTYDAKWRPGTPDFITTPPVNPASLDSDLAAEVDRLCQMAFRVVGCRDYARVDLRLGADGRPYILEVNPNPCISPLAGFACGLESARIRHSQFVIDLVEAALTRGTTGKIKLPRPALAVMVDAEGPGEPEGPPGHGGVGTMSRAASWQVRPARATDRAKLKSVTASCEVFTTEPFASTVARLLEPARGRRLGSELRIVHQRGRVGGFAAFRPDPHAVDAFVVDGFAVAAETQGRGLGRLLLSAVEAEVASRGGRLLVVEVASHAAFAVARQFLIRHGYRPTGEVPDFYGEDQARLSFVKYLPIQSASSAPPEENSPAGFS